MADPKRIVQLFSGGMDSTTLLYKLRADGHNVQTVSIEYGQRHSKETLVARQIAADLSVTHHAIQIRGLQLPGSCITDRSKEVPNGHYAEETMKLTVVPNRNMILIGIATAVAIAQGCDAVAYGAHQGDHAIYPDCRPVYITKIQEVLKLCDYKEIDFLTPFWDINKTAIAKIGHQLGVPYSMTWTCYKGLDIHCGTCGACTERREAFVESGVPDKTRYKIDEVKNAARTN